MKTRYRRYLAAFLLVNMIQGILLPSFTWALTTGPIMPEVDSFEPIDNTDMVNLLTGELTYTLPLIEVPGPEGGYPLALSYHAGIKPLEDASWVGLGWSLNAGAISRTVSGFPDDHNSVERKVTDTWEGGESHSFSIGVETGVGIVSSDLSYTHTTDTYEGSYGTVALQGAFQLTKHLSANAGISANSRGDINVHGGVGIGPTNFSTDFNGNYQFSGSAGLGNSTDFKGNGEWVLDPFQALEIITLKNSKGVSSSNNVTIPLKNARAGIVTSFTGKGSIPIGISGVANVHFGQSFTRYYIFENDHAKTYGIRQ